MSLPLRSLTLYYWREHLTTPPDSTHPSPCIAFILHHHNLHRTSTSSSFPSSSTYTIRYQQIRSLIFLSPYVTVPSLRNACHSFIQPRVLIHPVLCHQISLFPILFWHIVSVDSKANSNVHLSQRRRSCSTSSSAFPNASPSSISAEELNAMEF